MGHDETDGVVDAELRVFGTSNLFVAGAATYRTSSYADPTFTALALSARLVDLLTNAPSIVRNDGEALVPLATELKRTVVSNDYQAAV